MDKLSLIYVPHEFLSTVAKPFDFDNPILPVDFIESEMLWIVNAFNGVGLAANQVNLDARVFVMNRKYGGPLICFNPEVLQVSRMTEVAIEGCLSDPGKRYRIKRPKKCEIAFSDKSGFRRKLQLVGIDARCALHEIDHLNGINIGDREFSEASAP